jgi:nicotinamide-nucleotide amidase
MAADDVRSELVERVAAAAHGGGITVAVAESLTGGQLAAALSAGPDASRWFRGGVVAYSPEVKFRVLGVEPGPVVTAACAEQMAAGVAELTEASVALAVTGVGGPEPEESHPPGTVWLAVWAQGRSRAQLLSFDGSPAEVLEATVQRSLGILAETCRQVTSRSERASSA